MPPIAAEKRLLLPLAIPHHHPRRAEAAEVDDFLRVGGQEVFVGLGGGGGEDGGYGGGGEEGEGGEGGGEGALKGDVGMGGGPLVGG